MLAKLPPFRANKKLVLKNQICPLQLNQDAEVSVSIYNVSGRLVRTFPIGFRSAGIYLSQDKAIYWNGRTDNGETVSSGVYFYQLNAGDYSSTSRMVILK